MKLPDYHIRLYNLKTHISSDIFLSLIYSFFKKIHNLKTCFFVSSLSNWYICYLFCFFVITFSFLSIKLQDSRKCWRVASSKNSCLPELTCKIRKAYTLDVTFALQKAISPKKAAATTCSITLQIPAIAQFVCNVVRCATRFIAPAVRPDGRSFLKRLIKRW